jgi:hypothetical protein
MSRINTLEPAHSKACPPDCSQQLWQRVDEDAQTVVLVQTANGQVLGTFSTYARAYSFALTSGHLCSLIPQAIDSPEWGNCVTH